MTGTVATSLRLTVAVTRQLAGAFARSDREVCAVVAGRRGSWGRIVLSRIAFLKNEVADRHRFAIGSAALNRARTDLGKHGFTYHALIHSHPDGPLVPSGADIEAAALIQLPTLIYSYSKGRVSVRAFGLRRLGGLDLPVEIPFTGAQRARKT